MEEGEGRVRRACPFIKECEMYKALKKMAGRNIICYNNYAMCKIYRAKITKR